MVRMTPVVKNLLIINVGIYIFFQSILHYNLPQLAGFRYIFADTFQPWQIITYMFIHSDGWHLFGNMITLFFFGPLLEQYLGTKRFFIFFIATGLGAGLLFGLVNFWEVSAMAEAAEHILLSPSPDALHAFIAEYAPEYYLRYPNEQTYDFVNIYYPENPDIQKNIDHARYITLSIRESIMNIPMVGASGSVLGIIAAFGILFPELTLMLLFPPIPVKAKYLALFWGLYSVYSLIIQNPSDNVAHWAHLGGMLFAYLLIKYWGIDKQYF